MHSDARDSEDTVANSDGSYYINMDSQAATVDDTVGHQWHRQSIKETFERIATDPAHPWLAIGDFLDDWRFTEVADRLDLVREGIAPHGEGNIDLQRWASFCAAMVEWLCAQEGLPFPAWTSNDAYRLSEPWFLYPGDLLRAWQLVSTPAPFKMRNIFGGDQILSRA